MVGSPMAFSDVVVEHRADIESGAVPAGDVLDELVKAHQFVLVVEESVVAQIVLDGMLQIVGFHPVRDVVLIQCVCVVPDGVCHPSEDEPDVVTVDGHGAVVPVHREQLGGSGVHEAVEAVLVLPFVTHPVDAKLSIVIVCDVVVGEVVILLHLLFTDLKDC